MTFICSGKTDINEKTITPRYFEMDLPKHTPSQSDSSIFDFQYLLTGLIFDFDFLDTDRYQQKKIQIFD